MTDKIYKKNNDLSTIDVALLLKDMEEVQKISMVFRQTGIVPHYYESLRDFWDGTLAQMPSLCLVDVEKMSEGELLLKNHPSVKSEEMLLSFLYSNDSEPLLYSTFELYNIGLINKSFSYSGQIKSILRRYNKTTVQQKYIRKAKQDNRKLERQLRSTLSNFEEEREKKFYQDKLKSICILFEKQRNSDNFFQACEVVFNQLDEISEFAYLEINDNGQKLISHASSSSKYQKIPALWLDQICKNGIEQSAQDLANQVSVDLMGGEIISLMIKGEKELPEILLYISPNHESFLNNYDWQFFEYFLQGIYSFFKLRANQKDQLREKFLTPWELMTTLDHHLLSQASSDFNPDEVMEKINLVDKNDRIRLINIDFTSLIEILRNNQSIRFAWKDFYYDFLERLERKEKIDFKAICMGVNHLGLVVDRNVVDKSFSQIKGHAARYPYWRHFEDMDTILAKPIIPKVEMVPLSAGAYLRFIDGHSIGSFAKAKNSNSNGESENRNDSLIKDGPTVTLSV